MSTVNTIKKHAYKGVNVMRDTFPLARIFFDIEIYELGFAGYAVWQNNTFRVPVISHVRDILKRRNRGGKTIEDAVEADERNFYIKYNEVQGIVADGNHKELQLLTSNEQLTILFRYPSQYEEFLGLIEENLKDKIFKRDDTEVTHSVYIS